MSRFIGFAVLGVFGFLNATNWCSPGWCREYGWPFTHYFAGDATVVINGVASPSGFFFLPFLGNLLIAFTSASVAIWLAQRLERARRSAV
jgi:hypothetical protein